MRSPLFGYALLAVIMLWPSGGLADESLVIVRDRERIQDHLSGVEDYLRAQDTSHLSEVQRAMRAETIDRLHAYWVAGVFPHNTVATFPTPIFVDDGGRPCAVGYLMLEAGYQDAVAEITATQNLEYVETIESDGLLAWLTHSGITGREAAWIQPGYDFPPCSEECDCAESPVCAADGTTYVNSCFAETCFGEFDYEPGCCEGAETIVWNGDLQSDIEGLVPTPLICPEDPNESLAAVCTTFVEPPPGEGVGGSCSVARDADPGPWIGAAFLLLLLAGARRHVFR
ncbi:MAG: hypothetical protein AAGF92_17670 [Myxococcota bacterium]